jgi:glycosyltransferase involved in cell wall biosynthesis
LAQVENPNLRLVIAGVLQDDIKAEVETLIAADPRVTFLGWQGSEELTDLLCAADIYLQPGTQSATMQHSLCCGCAVILDAVPSHEPYVDRNGWLVKTEADLTTVLAKLAETDISAYKAASLSLSERMLDYTRLAARILD